MTDDIRDLPKAEHRHLDPKTMEGVTGYAGLINKSSEVRKQIDTEFRPQYDSLKKIYETLFGWPKRYFKLVNDLIYYQGGYPAPNSPPKDEDLADGIVAVIRTMECLGDTKFAELLRERGISVLPDPKQQWIDTPITEETWKLIKGLWENGMGEGRFRPASSFKALRLMITKAQMLQDTICRMSDSIKHSAGGVALAEHGIEKENFLEAVRLASLKLRRGEGEMSEKLQRVLRTAENLGPALAPLTGEDPDEPKNPLDKTVEAATRALADMGCSYEEAKTACRQTAKEGITLDQLVVDALRVLSGRPSA